VVTLRNSDIYSDDPRFPAPVITALQDIGRQRLNRDTGKLYRRIVNAVDAQIADVAAEKKRLLEVHARRDENDEPVTIQSDADITDKDALTDDYAALLNDTFECEGFPESALDNVSGTTWISPIVVSDAPASCG
jgi:hypothetical protein